MTRFTLLLAAIAICGPFAASAAVMPAPSPANAVMFTAAASDAPYQLAQLNDRVAVLTDKVQGLQSQYAPGTAYVAELSGVIPTGG